jgi:hypothetical protein
MKRLVEFPSDTWGDYPGRGKRCGTSGGLLMSGRRPNSDSGEPDLWSNGSVFMGSKEPISVDPSPQISLQQTTARAFLRQVRCFTVRERTTIAMASAC